MLNPSRKYGNLQDNLLQAIAPIFQKEFNPSKFFPLLMQITDDPDLRVPANLIFVVYNLLIREQPQTAFNGLGKIQDTNPHSIANVAALIVKGAYQAYTNKYKQSLKSVNNAVQLCQKTDLDKEFGKFYAEVIARMIQIYNFGAFRREYFSIIEKILKKYQNQIDNIQILKLLAQQQENLKSKICFLEKKVSFGTFTSSLPKNTYQFSKFTFRKQNKVQSNSKMARQRSDESNKSSKVYNIFSPRHKLKSDSKGFKPKKFTNPYGLNFNQSQINKCIFM